MALGRILSAFFVSAAVFAATPVFGLTLEDKTRVQAILVQHIEENSVDGQYRYKDAQDGSELTLYPANLHPKILDFGTLVLLCADFFDDAGNGVEVDFLARPSTGEWRIEEAFIDQRKTVVKRLIAELGAPK